MSASRELLACFVSFACSACGSHTVALFVPVKDARANTPVVAAITSSGLMQFDRATLHANGVVGVGETKVAKLGSDDLVVIEAAGDRFGTTEVIHGDGSIALEGFGVSAA